MTDCSECRRVPRPAHRSARNLHARGTSGAVRPSHSSDHGRLVAFPVSGPDRHRRRRRQRQRRASPAPSRPELRSKKRRRSATSWPRSPCSRSAPPAPRHRNRSATAGARSAPYPDVPSLNRPPLARWRLAQPHRPRGGSHQPRSPTLATKWRGSSSPASSNLGLPAALRWSA